MSEVIHSPRSRLDLLEIAGEIARDNPEAADRLLLRIEDRLRLLADNPMMGEARPDIQESLRSVSVGNYVIYFAPRNNGIELVRVIHGARDTGKTL